MGVVSNDETDDTPSPEPEQQAAQEEDPDCEKTLGIVRKAHAEAIEKYSENEEMVDYLSDLVERSGAGSPEGVPMEFPENLDEPYRPEGFAAAMEDLMQECPDLFPEDETRWDCDEYPCAIQMPLEGSGRNVNIDEDCPAFKEHFAGTGTLLSSVEYDGQHYGHVIPQGSGVGVRGHHEKHMGNMQRRMRHRASEARLEIARDLYDDACMYEGDTHACSMMAGALRGNHEERDVYLKLGCEERSADACHSYASSRCVDRGNCDGQSQDFARLAIELEGDNGRYHRTLAIILCQRGQAGQANATWQTACELGDELSCGQQCS